MTRKNVPDWLRWARELQAISQTGLHYSSNEHDTANYDRIRTIAAEMTSSATGLAEDDVLGVFRVHPAYATAKIDVRGAVIDQGRILLVRERVDGCWSMPGGWADVGEIPSDMVAREVREESGYEVEVEKVLGVFDANRSPVHLEFFHAYKILFLCRLTGGAPRPSDETSEVGFFDFDELPPLSLHRTNERHLAEVRAHLADPDRPAAFD